MIIKGGKTVPNTKVNVLEIPAALDLYRNYETDIKH